MIHEITKTMYQEFHKMGYTTELAVVGGDANDITNPNNYLATITCNLFKRETRQPIMGFVIHVGDMSKDSEKMELDYTLADFNMYQEDISFGEVAGVFGATRSMMYRLLQKDTKDLFAQEALLNTIDCAIESIRVSDMSNILDGVDGTMSPEVEYHFGIKRIGRAVLYLNEVTVAENTADAELKDCSADVLQDMLSLSQDDEEPIIDVETAGKLVLRYNGAIMNVIAQVTNSTVKFVKDEIMAYFQMVSAVPGDNS